MVGAGLRGGAALRLVLPHHRLRRHAAGRDRGARTGALDRTITVRFDANVAGGLPWRFEPEQNAIEVQARRGRHRQLSSSTNQAARETVGQAAYNVAPPTTGAYFEKINCFCFTEQRLEAGREARDAGRVLCRSGARQGFRTRRPQHDHAVLYVLSRCASRRKPVRGARRRNRRRTELGRARERNGERRRWPTRTPSTTTIISSIRARGRSSARSRPSCSRSG